MLNMNPVTIGLSFFGCFVYVSAMSALGRLLATCREESSVAYVAPPPSWTMRA